MKAVKKAVAMKKTKILTAAGIRARKILLFPTAVTENKKTKRERKDNDEY